MLAQKIALGYGILFLTQMVNFLGGVVVARIVGPHILGQLAFGLSFVSMFGFIAEPGLGMAHTKIVSEGMDLTRAVGTYFRLKIGASFIYAFAVGGVVWYQWVYKKASFSDTVQTKIIMLFLISTILGQIAQVAIATFAGRTEQAKKDIPLVGQAIVNQFVRVTFAALGFGAIALAVSHLIGVICFIVILWVLFKPYWSTDYDSVLARRYIRMAVPAFVLVIANTISENMDRVMLEYQSFTNEVGYYSVALSMVGFIKTFSLTVGGLFFPIFSAANAKGDGDAIKVLLRRYERFVFAVVLPLVCLIIVLAPAIVHLFLGPKYGPSSRVMAIAMVGTFFFVVNFPYMNLIAGRGKFTLLSLLSLLNLILLIVGGYFLTSSSYCNLGATGMGIAVGMVTIIVGYLHRMLALANLNSDRWRDHLKRVGIGVIYGASLFMGNAFALVNQINLARMGAFIVLIIITTALYERINGFSVLEEGHLMMKALDPKRMIHYIRREIASK